jgi:hypothetical protein
MTGDEHKVFSMCGVVPQHGVICYDLYVGGFSKPFYKDLQAVSRAVTQTV